LAERPVVLPPARPGSARRPRARGPGESWCSRSPGGWFVRAGPRRATGSCWAARGRMRAVTYAQLTGAW